MTKYYKYDNNGKATEHEDRPDSGFYYTDEGHPGGSIGSTEEYTLYEANPDGGEPRKVDSWKSLDDMETVTASDGSKYEAEWGGFLWGDRNGNPDKPKGDRDPQYTVPATDDRKDNTLYPTEELNSEETNGSRNSISSKDGNYDLTLESHGERDRLVLTDKDGKEIWGYSGDDAASLLSSDKYQIKLLSDGKIVIVDDKNEVKKVIRESTQGKDGKEQGIHAKLVLLHHPPHESKKLRSAIDEAQAGLQRQVDCFGKGKPDLAADVSEFLHSKGLTDKENRGDLAQKYNDGYLAADTKTKEKFFRLDSDIKKIAVDTDIVNSKAFDGIMNLIFDLDDQLRAVEFDADYDRSATDDGKGGKEVHFSMKPNVENPIFKSLGEVPTDVAQRIASAHEQNNEKEKEADDKHGDDDKDGGEDKEDPPSEKGPPWEKTPRPDPNGQPQPPRPEPEQSKPESEKPGAPEDKPDSEKPGTPEEVDEVLNKPPDYGSGTDETETGTSDPGGENPGQEETGQQSSSAGGGQQAGAGGGSGMEMMKPMMMMASSAIPQAMQAMQQKRDEDAGRSEEERKKEAGGQEQGQPPGAGPQDPGAAPPAGATAAPAATAPPPVNGTGMVDAQLPDGTTQKVSSTVAEALNKEVNNPNGSDARAAYSGTPGEATAANSWVAVDTANIQTGDVVQWENRSAVAVVSEDGLSYISNGQLVPLDTNNPADDGHGSYGAFQGFFHPSGADTTDAGSQATQPPEPSVPTPPTPEPTAPPAVTAPAPSAAV